MKILSVFVFLCSITLHVIAQKHDTLNPYVYRANVLNGNVKDIFSDLPPHKESTYLELEWHKQANQNIEWENTYFFPERGYTFLYGNLGNDSVMGSVFSIYPSWYFSVLRTKRIGLLLKAGVGFAYFNKPFNLYNNPTNIFVGSNITNITNIGASLRIRLTNNLHVSTGASFVHFSNGHVKAPNVGINDNRYYLGLQYTPNQKTYTRIHPPKDDKNPLLYNVRLGLGLHESSSVIRPIGGQIYPIYNAAFYVSKQKNYHDFYIGLYFMYYEGFYNFIKHEDLYLNKEHINSMVISSFIGHEFLFKRFSFVQEIGQKIYNPLFNDYGPFQPEYIKGELTAKNILSARLGFFYYWLNDAKIQKNNLATGLFIKSNSVQADFVEINLSYSL